MPFHGTGVFHVGSPSLLRSDPSIHRYEATLRTTMHYPQLKFVLLTRCFFSRPLVLSDYAVIVSKDALWGTGKMSRRPTGLTLRYIRLRKSYAGHSGRAAKIKTSKFSKLS